MTFLWTTDEMIAAMHARPIGNLPAGITGLSIDSRSIGQGEAFFAIKGDRVDGHDYASMAIANGAALLVVSEAKLPALGRLSQPMIVVDDVLAALGRLGIAARARCRARIVAVTGSVGKTTTKEMLRRVLEPTGSVHAAVASFNNHWGVPLTLARMPAEAEFGVFEIGMNHPGEISPLVRMVRPHVAMITTVAAAHLGNFRNLKEIAAAKAEIFDGVEPGGHAVLNRDNGQFDFLQKTAHAAGIDTVVTFGNHSKADFRLIEFVGGPEGSRVTAVLDGEQRGFTLGAPGKHIAENALAALACVSILGADLDAALAALSSLSAVKGRGARHRLGIAGGTFTLIDESYNANPASMRAAIAVLAAAAPVGEGRRVAVLGDMLEMGEFAEKVHGDLASPLLAAGITDVWLAGPEMRVLSEALPENVSVSYFETTDALSQHVVASVRPGDVVMVKSSLGIGFGRIVSALLDKYPALQDIERH